MQPASNRKIHSTNRSWACHERGKSLGPRSLAQIIINILDRKIIPINPWGNFLSTCIRQSMKTNSGISSLHSQTISVRYYSTGLPNRESNDLTEKFPFCSTVSEGNLGPFLISFSTQQPEPTERKKNTFEESEKSHSNTIGYCNATEIIADSLHKDCVRLRSHTRCRKHVTKI